MIVTRVGAGPRTTRDHLRARLVSCMLHTGAVCLLHQTLKREAATLTRVRHVCIAGVVGSAALCSASRTTRLCGRLFMMATCALAWMHSARGQPAKARPAFRRTPTSSVAAHLHIHCCCMLLWSAGMGAVFLQRRSGRSYSLSPDEILSKRPWQCRLCSEATTILDCRHDYLVSAWVHLNGPGWRDHECMRWLAPLSSLRALSPVWVLLGLEADVSCSAQDCRSNLLWGNRKACWWPTFVASAI